MRAPRNRRKRRRLGSSANSCTRRHDERPNHVRSNDVVFDRLKDGHQMKILAVADECAREHLCLHVARSITLKDVVDQLAQLVLERGAPEYICSDKGLEFIAAEIRAWIEIAGSSTLFIEPGAPWESAYIESFNSELRDELLSSELFTTFAGARDLAEQDHVEYNTKRPHRSLDYLTSVEFAASYAQRALVPNSQYQPQRALCSRHVAADNDTTRDL